MKKRILAMALALVLVVGALPITAEAVDYTYKTWSQWDPRWGSMSISSSGYGHSMAVEGCYVTAVAKLLVHAGQQDPARFTPKECLQGMLAHNMLSADGGMCYENFNYSFLPTYGAELFKETSDSHEEWSKNTAVSTIGGKIREGYYVIVCVINRSTGNTHYMAVDYVSDDIYVMDNGGVYGVYGSGRYSGVKDQVYFKYNGDIKEYPVYGTPVKDPVKDPVVDIPTSGADGSYRSWSQNDQRWNSLSIAANGDGSWSMGRYGGYVTAIAKLLVHAGQKDPAKFTPKECLQALLASNMLNDRGDLLYENYNNIFLPTYGPELTKETSPDHSAWDRATAISTISGKINSGYYVIVVAKNNSTGTSAWMTVDYVDNQDIYVMDNGGVVPLYGTPKYSGGVIDQVYFKYHGNKTYPAYDAPNCDKGHTWGEWKVVVAATCDDDGQSERICEVCGEVGILITQARDHNYSVKQETDTSILYVCANCGNSFSRAKESSGTVKPPVTDDSDTPPEIVMAEGTLPLPTTRAYVPDLFWDVKGADWFYTNVADAYEMDLMNGTGNGTFSPGNNMTIAEAVTLAARIHSLYHNGKESFTRYDGGSWYDPYVDYARENRIIDVNYDYSRPATREEFIHILARALPEKELENIAGTVTFADSRDITYLADVRLLSGAGVINGIPENGKTYFKPTATITRAEVAAVITRMAKPALRKG